MRRNSQKKGVSCPNMSMKSLHLEGLSKAFIVEFKAVEDNINSISAGRGQHSDYLQTIYKYIKELLKAYVIM